MKIKTNEIVLVGLFAALMTVGAFLKIPFYPVSFSLQFLFCAMSGIILGAKLGSLSQLVYVIIGLIGFPVFTNGGGPAYIFQPSFGYLIGFIVAAFVIGLVWDMAAEKGFFAAVAACVCGMIVLYLIGVPYLLMIVNFYLGSSLDIVTGAMGKNGFLYFMLVDCIKIVIVAVMAPIIVKRLKPESRWYSR